MTEGGMIESRRIFVRSSHRACDREVRMEFQAEQVMITTFTDSMMGLSYECEPIFRKLETHYGHLIEFQYVMSGLVKDVYRLVHALDLKKGKEYAIAEYNKRLAKIYEEEESISGMPVNMTDFHLFSPEHTSSIPLNLAYEAVKLTDMEKADPFLYNLRFATIVECRPTTHLDEIRKVVRNTGIREEMFMEHYQDGSAEKCLKADIEKCLAYGIFSLPSYLIQYKEKAVLVQELIGYDSFVSLIDEISEGRIRPIKPILSSESLWEFFQKHPLISPIEIREAFDLESMNEVDMVIKPFLEKEQIWKEKVYHGSFYRISEQ